MIVYQPITSGGGSCPTADQIADAVWSKPMSGFTTSGTFGAFVQKLLTVGKFLGLQ